MVRYYVRKYDPDAGSDKAKVPTPEPSDIQKAALVNFDDIEQELKKLFVSIKRKTFCSVHYIVHD